MSFTDDLKRSLGFEETDSSKNGPGIMDSIRDLINPEDDFNGPQSQPQQQYRPTPKPQQGPVASHPRPTPVYDDFDDFVIIPEQSYYEIILIRPKSIDDINYIVDQILEEKNPVIVDLSFLERESAPNFRLAKDKINQMRSKYGAQALLLSRSEDKNLIILSPKKVKVVNKG